MSYENISADSVRNNKGKIAYDLAKMVPVSNDSMRYLNGVNNVFNELDLNELQCKTTMKLFENVIRRSRGFINLGDYKNIDTLNGNEILFVVVPLVESFHAVVVVINMDKTRVDIYQSNGKNVRLFKTTLTFEEFESSFNKLLSLHSRVKDTRALEKLPLYELENIFNEFVVLEQKLFSYDRRIQLDSMLKRFIQTAEEEEEDEESLEELKSETIIHIFNESRSEIKISVYIPKPSRVSRGESGIIKIQKMVRRNISRKKIKKSASRTHKLSF